jgi:capsular polysaccharide biosynthesis protein
MFALVEIAEVFDRIVRVHWKLIAVCLLAGAVAGLTIHTNDRPTYTATARVVLDTPDATSETEAQAIADTARAIVTSHSLVERALAKSGVRRSVIQLADQGISVEPIGSSSIVEVAVTDPDPGTAARLANELSRDLILTRLRSGRGPLDEALSRIEQRIAQLEASLEVLNNEIAVVPDLETEVRLSRERDVMIQRLVLLEQERADLLSTQAERPTPQILDHAKPSPERDPSGLPADVALGGLLGLVLGISLSVGQESLRPTVVGGPAVARELDAPVLGFLPTPPGRSQPEELGPVAAWLSAAAESAGVRTVALMSTRREEALDSLAAGLSERLNGSGSIDIRPLESIQWGKGTATRTVVSSAGVVVVTPLIVGKSELAALRDLARVTEGRVLGAIAYRGSTLGTLIHRRKVNQA